MWNPLAQLLGPVTTAVDTTLHVADALLHEGAELLSSPSTRSSPSICARWTPRSNWAIASAWSSFDLPISVADPFERPLGFIQQMAALAGNWRDDALRHSRCF